MFSTDHNEMLHISRQCYCHDVCKILLWLVEYVLNKSITKFHWISNLIEISLVGQVPGDDACNEQEIYHDIMSGVSLGIMYVILVTHPIKGAVYAVVLTRSVILTCVVWYLYSSYCIIMVCVNPLAPGRCVCDFKC